MFSSPVLDLVILLSFIYFVGSLILSSFNEAISGLLSKRQKQLRQALENLLFDPAWANWVQGTLMKSPHIQSLIKATDKYPSYIPSSNFVLAVISQIGPSNFTTANLQQGIAGSGMPPQFIKVLSDLAAKVGNDITKFQTSLEDFYDNAMDRASGVYKRKIRLFLLVIGFVVACCLNLDTIQIVQQELGNKADLKKTADQISQQLSRINNSKDSHGTFTIQDANGTIRANGIVDTSKTANQDLDQVKKLTVYLGQASGYELGYTNGDAWKEWTGTGDKQCIIQRIEGFLVKLLGIAITAFALQLSSGFWFDLMNKAVNIRAAGTKPKKNE